ncbi:MAG: CHAD domain-containing protein [Bacteroidota bacterium]|nr:CHAD domain-containing protein [Bacteroidota bacterium]MDP4229255.1 CHAD domain-containing protein [Bacteroidota bacterium]MDP4236234.1 CHAD domain-containing protein [Bacteroidota bacterium]
MLTYYRTIYREYRRILRRLLRMSDPETVHELRVVIKKLRALYELISEVEQHFDFDLHFDPIKSVFKAAGRIRDIDITLDCLKESQELRQGKSEHITTVLDRYRNSHLSFARKIVRESIRDMNKSHLEIEKILSIGIKSRSAEQFLKERVSKIRNIRRKHLSKTRLHTIRKLYKEYLYISKASGSITVPLGDTLSQVDELQKRIGRWHDYLIATSVIEIIKPAGEAQHEIWEGLEKLEKKMRRSIIKKL